jgi:hypothetical protein
MVRIHEDLLADGIAFHTLASTPGGAAVYMADLDESAADAIEKAAERYGSEVEVHFGRAEFLGTDKQDGTDREQRDSARRVFEENIAESPVQGSAEIWDRIRDSWGKELTLADTAQREFDPNEPRDSSRKWTSAVGAKPVRIGKAAYAAIALKPAKAEAVLSFKPTAPVIERPAGPSAERCDVPASLASQAQLNIAAGDKAARDIGVKPLVGNEGGHVALIPHRAAARRQSCRGPRYSIGVRAG